VNIFTEQVPARFQGCRPHAVLEPPDLSPLIGDPGPGVRHRTEVKHPQGRPQLDRLETARPGDLSVPGMNAGIRSRSCGLEGRIRAFEGRPGCINF
jgi:hypothetical protein